MPAFLYSALTAALEARVQPLSILIYHRILSSADPMRPDETTLETFRWHMELLRKYFNPLPLDEAAKHVRAGSLPPRSVCVTFDDGYADNLRLALPVLQANSVPATVFVSTAYLDGGRMWNDTIIESVRAHQGEYLSLPDYNLIGLKLQSDDDRFRAARDIIRAVKHLDFEEREEFSRGLASRSGTLPDGLMLTTAQLQALGGDPLITIGAHTHRHPILATLDRTAAGREISMSKAILEEKLDKPVRSFAYPNGRPELDYSVEHPTLVRQLGFDLAVTTQVGVATRETDAFQLPRFTPWDRTAARFLVRMLRTRQKTVSHNGNIV